MSKQTATVQVQSSARDTLPASTSVVRRQGNPTPRNQSAPVLTPRDDGGVKQNQQVAGSAGVQNAPAEQKRRGRTGPRKGYITPDTQKDVDQIVTVLNANFVDKKFRLAELMELLPKSLINSWDNPALDLNRFIKRVMGLPEVGKAENTGIRGRRPNLYYYSGTYNAKRVLERTPTPATPVVGKRELNRQAKEAAKKALQEQKSQGQSARDTGAPVQQAPATQSNVVSLQQPAAQSAPVEVKYDEVHNVNGIEYKLGGDSVYVRRTTNDPVNKRMVAAVYDISNGTFVRVNDDIVRLPSKSKK